MTTPTVLPVYNRVDAGKIPSVRGFVTPSASDTDAYTLPSTAALAATSGGGAGPAVLVIAGGYMTITTGFEPTHVKLTNVTDKTSQEWFKGMASGSYIEKVAAGDETLETDSDLLVSLRTGVGGSVSQAAGTADTTPAGVVTIKAGVAFKTATNLEFVIEG